MTRRKAVVAMSGGVDSSVAAATLVADGYDVTGIMLKLWRGASANTASGCCNVGAADDARRVADVLGIPFYVLNLAERFEDSVVKDFHRAYASGQTPNPCVRCNQWVKFDALFERAMALGADVLATGHYARVESRDGRFRLLRGRDGRKDQSYVLWMLTQNQLSRSSFPVGAHDKTETRRIAADLGLRTAAKPDSQEICFVPEGDFDAYVGDHMHEATRPGPIVDSGGRVLGEHRGIGRYTVGQRKGLGISLGVPVFVTGVDANANAIVVGPRSDLGVSELVVDEVSFVAEGPEAGCEVLVQHRAHGEVTPGSLHPVSDGRVLVRYDEAAEAVAPGQSAAFYDAASPDELIGGGIISSTVAATAVA
ncbi:MAG: tRNA 2-thiouridine(34) synthase MnmA [Actinomycetota bacterium]|nr:tRNA 2-thiouridine(34) synthase MnmA [Actinomycetota bacterium]